MKGRCKAIGSMEEEDTYFVIEKFETVQVLPKFEVVQRLVEGTWLSDKLG